MLVKVISGVEVQPLLKQRFFDPHTCMFQLLFVCVCFKCISRHLDFFEMLRNEDELLLSKRFDTVSPVMASSCRINQCVSKLVKTCVNCLPPGPCGDQERQPDV